MRSKQPVDSIRGIYAAGQGRILASWAVVAAVYLNRGKAWESNVRIGGRVYRLEVNPQTKTFTFTRLDN